MVQSWRITPLENLKVEIDASTLDEVTKQLPEGYYSTFRTFEAGTRVLGLASHLRRLYEPVSTPEVNEATLRGQLRVLLDAYSPGDARVRLAMTEDGQAYVAIAPLTPLPREVYEKGVRVETTELQRKHPHLKSTSFIGRSDSERKHIAQEGIFEALLVKDGKILEGMTSNFFYILGRDGIPPYLGTAGGEILPGITREIVLDIARSRKFTVKFQPLKLADLNELSEAFITSSSRGVVPVVQIDHDTIGQGSPGPITGELMAAYEAYVLAHAEKL